jgi:citrate lyase beta subunit
VALVASLFDQAGKTCVLVPMIESARGVFAVESIARSSSHVGELMSAPLTREALSAQARELHLL